MAWRRCRGGVAALLILCHLAPARAAEAPFPFEGTWVRADRACTSTTVRERTYTAKEVVSPRGRCAIRRISQGPGIFELLEECRRSDRPVTITETIRLTSPDSMTLKRQVSRLKIPRQVHYARCVIAAAPPPAPAPAATPPRAGKSFAPPGDAKQRDKEP